MERLFELIKEVRLDLGESQLQFAQRFGFKNDSSCNRWEHGVRPETIPTEVVDFVFNYKTSSMQKIMEELKRRDIKYDLAWEDEKGVINSHCNSSPRPDIWAYKKWLVREAPAIREEQEEKRKFQELEKSLGLNPITH